MTNEIEKTFLNTFEIEPIIEQCYHFCNKGLNCKECDEATKIYPPITDRILLELICIINQIDLYFYNEYDYFISDNYKDLKEEVLTKCKRLSDKNALLETTGEDMKQQVRTLFEET